MDNEILIPRCKICNSVVKPDVLMYNEKLPDRFFELAREDFPKCDLLICSGTSLKISPFSELIDMVFKNTLIPLPKKKPKKLFRAHALAAPPPLHCQ